MTDADTTPARSADDATDLSEVELALPLDTICLIVAKARELQGKTASSDPSASALDDDDIAAAVLEDRPSDPVAQEIASTIADLSVDAQIDLVTLMWLGRDEGDWADLRAIAASEHTAETPAYLCGTPLLADYLMAGLAAFGLNCGEFLDGHA